LIVVYVLGLKGMKRSLHVELSELTEGRFWAWKLCQW